MPSQAAAFGKVGNPSGKELEAVKPSILEHILPFCAHVGGKTPWRLTVLRETDTARAPTSGENAATNRRKEARCCQQFSSPGNWLTGLLSCPRLQFAASSSMKKGWIRGILPRSKEAKSKNLASAWCCNQWTVCPPGVPKPFQATHSPAGGKPQQIILNRSPGFISPNSAAVCPS